MCSGRLLFRTRSGSEQSGRGWSQTPTSMDLFSSSDNVCMQLSRSQDPWRRNSGRQSEMPVRFVYYICRCHPPGSRSCSTSIAASLTSYSRDVPTPISLRLSAFSTTIWHPSKVCFLEMAAPRRLLSSISPATLGVAAAAGAGVVAFNMSRSSASPAEPQKSLGQKPVFPAMGFLSLTLEEARMVNHDTKELKFRVPGDGAISGLSPVCKCLLQEQEAGDT